MYFNAIKGITVVFSGLTNDMYNSSLAEAVFTIFKNDEFL